MKRKSLALYASVMFNAVLLVLVIWPADSDRFVLGQVASNVGPYAAVSSQMSSSRDTLWLADRVSGMLIVFDYDQGDDERPLQASGTRDLREDLIQRQVGNLMLISTNTSSSRSIVCVIDTDSEKMAVYTYDRGDRRIEPVQRVDLRVALGKVAPAPL